MVHKPSIPVSGRRASFRAINSNTCLVELGCGNVLSTPVGRTNLNVIMGVARVTHVGKVKKNPAVDRDCMTFTLKRRSKSL